MQMVYLSNRIFSDNYINFAVEKNKVSEVQYGGFYTQYNRIIMQA